MDCLSFAGGSSRSHTPVYCHIYKAHHVFTQIRTFLASGVGFALICWPWWTRSSVMSTRSAVSCGVMSRGSPCVKSMSQLHDCSATLLPTCTHTTQSTHASLKQLIDVCHPTSSHEGHRTFSCCWLHLSDNMKLGWTMNVKFLPCYNNFAW